MYEVYEYSLHTYVHRQTHTHTHAHTPPEWGFCDIHSDPTWHGLLGTTSYVTNICSWGWRNTRAGNETTRLPATCSPHSPRSKHWSKTLTQTHHIPLGSWDQSGCSGVYRPHPPPAMGGGPGPPPWLILPILLGGGPGGGLRPEDPLELLWELPQLFPSGLMSVWKNRTMKLMKFQKSVGMVARLHPLLAPTWPSGDM